MISGFEEPNEGSIFIAGQDMKGKRPYERNVGLLFQDYALFPHMNVVQNVGYGLKNRGYEKSRIPARIREMLELVKLVGFEDRRPAQLSGGQQQRVALARALAVSPEVVLLDEPLSALDAKLRQELRVELKEILSAVGATTIVVTHDQEEAMSLGDSVIVMSEGRIMQTGPADRDLCRSQDPVRRRVHRSIQLVQGQPRGRGGRERSRVHDQRRAQAAGASGRAGRRPTRAPGRSAFVRSASASIRAGAPRPAPADPPIG